MLHAAWMDSFILLDSSGGGAETRRRHIGPPESGFRRRDGVEGRLSCILSTAFPRCGWWPSFCSGATEWCHTRQQEQPGDRCPHL